MKSPIVPLLILELCLASRFPSPSWAAAASEFPAYTARLWQTSDGLPQDDVQALCQTRDGYLCVGTQQGLARFDGVRFTPLASRASLESKSHARTLVCAGPDGAMWSTTEDGRLRLWKNENESEISLPVTMTNSLITRIFPSRDGALWVGTDLHGLLRFKDSQFKQWTTNEGLAHHSVRSICEDQDGTIWVATGAGVNRWQAGKMTTLTTQNGLPHNSIRVVCADRKGNLWVASNFGLTRWKDSSGVHFTKKDGLSDNLISAIFEDRKGTIWIGTLNGLNRFVNGRWVAEMRGDGTSYDRVNCIFEDQEGNLWIGSRDGLSRLKARAVTALTQQQGLTHNTVTCVLQDQAENLWVGFWGGGVNKIENGKVTAYTKRDGLSSDLVLTLLQNRQGEIWFGMDYDGGMDLLQNGEFTRYGAWNGLKDQAIKVFEEDSRTNLWIGTRTALLRFKDGKFARFTTLDGLPSDTIEAIHEDHTRHLWFGTTGGLAVRQNGKFKTFTTADGLSHNSITAIYEDRAGTLWLGTRGGGLNRWAQSPAISGDEVSTPQAPRLSSFHGTAFTTAQGLLADQIFAVLEDDFGFLWMSSPQGVFRVKKKNLDEFVPGQSANLACISLGKADGMASIECRGTDKTAACKSKDGRLWFATAKGVAVVDPRAVEINQIRPPVLVEEVVAGRKTIERHTERVTETQTPLEVPPGRGELEIHYTALSLSASEKNRFRFKLEGVDPDWINAETRRTAYYNNLYPGKYRFRVIACNNDGVWNEQGAALVLVLLPQLWQTKWFIGLLSLSAIGLVASVARYMTWKKVQHKLLRLEQQHAVEKERSRIAQDMHDDLGAQLTEILLMSEVAAKNAGDQTAKAQMGEVVSVAREVVRNLDGIVWAVNPQNDSLEKLAGYLHEYTENYLRRSSIRCRMEMPEKLPDVPLSSEVRHNIFLTIKEALHNMVKHSGASEVKISLQADAAALRISLADNGRGFAMVSVSTFGNGLRNMRKRIEGIGGKFDLQSEPQKGTRIELEIPLHR